MSARAGMDPIRRAGRSALAGRLETELRRRGVDRHGSLLVAVSGGADSTALLLLTGAVARRRGWTVECATVDHHLRPDSAADADSVTGLCGALGIPCHRLEVWPGAGPGAPARARRDRYAALARCASERGLAAVVTAHHAHDQLETMLLAIARGAGVRAAGGMPARRRLAPGVELLRPLLEVPGPALAALCRALGISWREDPSNRNPASPRALLREAVVPVLERLRPGAAPRAALLAALLRSAGRSVERRAARRASAATVTKRGEAVAVDRTALRSLPRAKRLEAIRAFLRAQGRRLGAARLNEVEAAVAGRGRHRRRWPLSGGAAIELVADRLRIIDPGSAPDSSAPRSGSSRSRSPSPPAASRSTGDRTGA